MLHVALHVQLRLLAIGRRRQRDGAEHARADPLGQGANGAALAGRIAALENNDHAQALIFDPLLELTQLALKFAQLFQVFLATQLIGVVGVRFVFLAHRFWVVDL